MKNTDYPMANHPLFRSIAPLWVLVILSGCSSEKTTTIQDEHVAYFLGTWVVENAVLNGAPQDTANGNSYTFEDDRVTLRLNSDGSTHVFQWGVAPLNEQKGRLFMHSMWRMTGEPKDPCWYQLDKDGKLSWVVGDQVDPENENVRPGKERLFVELRRMKPDPAQTAL